VLRKTSLFCLLVLGACQLPAEKKALALQKLDTVRLQDPDTNEAKNTVELPPLPLPQPKKEKDPKGYYSVQLPGGALHTVRFGADHSYELEERYKGDSIVSTQGNWSPSNGFIWLYKDQVVRARYRWNNGRLEYYDPATKKGLPLYERTEISRDAVWAAKKKEGIAFYGIGNEPFWSVSLFNTDSVQMILQDQQVKLFSKLQQLPSASDSLVFVAADSIRLTICNCPCSDGMSDRIYPQAVQLHIKNQVYKGCGLRYR